MKRYAELTLIKKSKSIKTKNLIDNKLIGRFSCLSCADVANITSYYNGKKYSYIMYKNGGGINIDKISEIEGDFKNGLEVFITMKTDASKIKEALKSLCFFDKLYISVTNNSYYYDSLKTDVENFNNRSIKEFKTFSTCSLFDGGNYFRVGHVIYEIPSGFSSFLSNLNMGLFIKLPIGSVDITPNREALQYTDYTNKTINKQIEDLKKELQEMYEKEYCKDMSLSEFYSKFLASSLCQLSSIPYKSFPTSIFDLNTSNVTIDGDKLPENYKQFLSAVRYKSIPKDFIWHTLNIKYRGTNVTFRSIIQKDIFLMLKTDKVTKAVTKAWIKENSVKKTVIISKEALNDYKLLLKEGANACCIENIDELISFTFKHIPISILSNSDVPLQFIEDYKKQRVKITNSNDISIRNYFGTGYSLGKFKNIYKMRGLMLYMEHTRDDSVLKELCNICIYPNSGIYCIFTIKKEFIPLLKNNKKFMLVEEFMYVKNQWLSKFMTAYTILQNFQKDCNSSDNFITYMNFPIFKAFVAKYKKQIQILQSSNFRVNFTFKSLLKYYTDKGWLNKLDIEYYKLSAKDIEANKYFILLNQNKETILKMMAIRKFGILPKIGFSNRNKCY